MKNKSLIITILAIITVIFISIIYTTVPRLELNGVKTITLSYREIYEEAGVILKNANSKNLSKVKIENNIENGKIGNYHVDYSLKLGSKTLKIRRNIKIIDDIPPVIKLNGKQIIEIKKGEEYKEQGYKATDEYDGDLTNKVEVIGDINTKEYGEQIIKYRVKDASNNITEVNRIVKIIDKTPPDIICESNYSAFEKNEKNLVGCKAIDDFDGDITEKIIISGTYDTTEEGIYNIEYSVEDDAGNQSKINHNIIIFEKIKNKKAYLLIPDTKELEQINEKNELVLTIINQQELSEEEIEILKETNYQIGLQIKDKKFNNIKELIKYLNDNNIEYKELDKNKNFEQTLIELKDNKIILIYKNETLEHTKTLIQILKEMGYEFDILKNYE